VVSLVAWFTLLSLRISFSISDLTFHRSSFRPQGARISYVRPVLRRSHESPLHAPRPEDRLSSQTAISWNRYTLCMSEQIAVRIPDRLAADLEAMVESGRFATKAEAVRYAIETVIDEERRRRIGEQIVEGYRRIPQTDEDVAAATEAAIRSIEEEPW